MQTKHCIKSCFGNTGVHLWKHNWFDSLIIFSCCFKILCAILRRKKWEFYNWCQKWNSVFIEICSWNIYTTTCRKGTYLTFDINVWEISSTILTHSSFWDIMPWLLILVITVHWKFITETNFEEFSGFDQSQAITGWIKRTILYICSLFHSAMHHYTRHSEISTDYKTW